MQFLNAIFFLVLPMISLCENVDTIMFETADKKDAGMSDGSVKVLNVFTHKRI